MRWVDDVKGLYKDIPDIPDYIEELISPMRDVYKTAEMREQDLLETEVTDQLKYFILF